MSPKRLALLAMLMLTPELALAHEAPGPHGGRLTDAGDGHFEFVANANALTLYVLDGAEKPRLTAGAKGRAVVQAAGKTSQLDLAPQAPNLLTARLDAPLPKGAVVVVSATLDGKPVQARFTIE